MEYETLPLNTWFAELADKDLTDALTRRAYGGTWSNWVAAASAARFADLEAPAAWLRQHPATAERLTRLLIVMATSAIEEIEALEDAPEPDESPWCFAATAVLERREEIEAVQGLLASANPGLALHAEAAIGTLDELGETFVNTGPLWDGPDTSPWLLFALARLEDTGQLDPTGDLPWWFAPCFSR